MNPSSIDARWTDDATIQDDSLAERLCAELELRWSRGERVLAEELLDRHPELWQLPEKAVDVVYEEFCLRQGAGEPDASLDVLRRFPQWRAELEVLFECHRALAPRDAAAGFPSIGEMLGEFHLVAELGRGGAGRVYLATQSNLADRPMVLKLTQRAGREHLSLARLQHTHVVPLYWVRDELSPGLRILCLPFFGGATLARLLESLRDKPVERRTGLDLLVSLDRIQRQLPLPTPDRGAGRTRLASSDWVESICWIGACLADALNYAHERGLVHLDVKASNVLLAGDGQPMLLDFHLAQPPLLAETIAPEWMGGTPHSMSPEQRQALAAVRTGGRVATTVDGRSDIYSLGLMLYEALSGGTASDGATDNSPRAKRESSTAEPTSAGGAKPPLRRINRRVSVGLSDVIARCLSADPRQRYEDAGALAADLRRHLADQPLVGVGNRSLVERWQKWRRRQPYTLPLMALVFTVSFAVLAAGQMREARQRRQLEQAQHTLARGQEACRLHHHAEAVHLFEHGLALAGELGVSGALVEDLRGQLHRARRELVAADLHDLVDRLRFAVEADVAIESKLADLERQGEILWNRLPQFTLAGDLHVDRGKWHGDLVDFVLLWSDLRIRLATEADQASRRREALDALASAEARYGSSVALCLERQRHAGALGWTDEATAAGRRARELTPRSAWDHYAIGRALVRLGDLEGAANAFDRSVRLDPGAFWPNFARGSCCLRRRHFADAATAFTACIALAPESAACHYHRALALAASDRLDEAFRDYGEAIRHDPTLAAAWLNRGVVQYRLRQYDEALADLAEASRLGATLATVAYNRALVHVARGERRLAIEELRKSLEAAPANEPSRELLRKLIDRDR